MTDYIYKLVLATYILRLIKIAVYLIPKIIIPSSFKCLYNMVIYKEGYNFIYGLLSVSLFTLVIICYVIHNLQINIFYMDCPYSFSPKMMNNEYTIDQNITLFQKEECERKRCIFYFNNKYSSFNNFYICNFNSYYDNREVVCHDDDYADPPDIDRRNRLLDECYTEYPSNMLCVKTNTIVFEDLYHNDLSESAKSLEGSVFYKNCKNYVKEFYYCSRNDITKKFKFKKKIEFCLNKKEINYKTKVCFILYMIFGPLCFALAMFLNIEYFPNIIRDLFQNKKSTHHNKNSSDKNYKKCDICLEIKEDISKFPCTCFLNICDICKEKLTKVTDICPGCRRKIKF